MKWVGTNTNGKWSVKMLGDNYAIFDRCESEWFCERADGYAGTFLRNGQGDFSVTWITSSGKDGKRVSLNVAAGKCSKL